MANAPSQAQTDTSEKDKATNAWCAGLAELLFVLLPFIVIAVVSVRRNEISKIFYIPEWSLVAAVVIGQAIVKFISWALSTTVYTERIILAVGGIIVLMLVPCLIVLSLVLTSSTVSLGLAIAQITFFTIGVTLFTAIVIGSHVEMSSETEKQ